MLFCDESIDYRKILRRAEEGGIRSETEREELRVRLKNMSQIDESGMREHLEMSKRGRFVKVEGEARTHNVQFLAPEVVVEEVRWVLDGVEV